MNSIFSLNENANNLVDALEASAEHLRIRRATENSSRVYDFGIEAIGGLKAGLVLAHVCMSGLGRIELIHGSSDNWPGPAVQVATDQPVAACMASQYAGWQITHDDYFAMGSGPMRAAAGREELYDTIGYREYPSVAVGVLESKKLPSQAVCSDMASKCGLSPERLTLLVAGTASIAGSIQVVARSVETAMHKLFELGFDVERVVSGYGTAPLPPVAENDLQGIGRTNDAVLYGACVTLWVRGDDLSIESILPRIPSNASSVHGETFLDIFEKAGRDFYRVDPLLFSPARVTFYNVDTGNLFQAGEIRPDVLRQSFGARP